MSSKQKIYCIIDIETTGGLAARDKITEIAIVKYDGKEIIDQFSSLINPERSIPPEITRITGITNQMVAGAPKFYEVAKKIVEMTKDCIFVAHNVNFDYRFIKEEFAKLAYTYSSKSLCTVRLSRKAFPGLKSYSLGNLIQRFGIKVEARHRALDDALATTKVFEYILKAEAKSGQLALMLNKGVRESKLPENISIDRLHSLPEEPGVYYFINSYQKIIYIGKSINIKQRVLQHFSQVTAKSEKMMKMVADLDYELTGSELISLVHENYEIKRHLPEINRIQRTQEFPYILFWQIDSEGFLNLEADKYSEKKHRHSNILSNYSSIQAAKSVLAGLRQQFSLCETKIAIKGKANDACIYFAIGECFGCCKNIESADEYNLRAEMAIEGINRIFSENFFIITKGKSNDENGVLLVEDGHYRGFGYFDGTLENLTSEDLKECINYVKPNQEMNNIVYGYLNSKKDYKKIPI